MARNYTLIQKSENETFHFRSVLVHDVTTEESSFK